MIRYLREHLPFFSDVLEPSARQSIDKTLRPLLQNGPELGRTATGPAKYGGDEVPYYPCIFLRHFPSGRLIGDLRLLQAEGSTDVDQEARSVGRVQQTAPPSEQVWEIAYNLMPEWRGKGIAGHMLDVIMAGWVEWAGIGTVMGVSPQHIHHNVTVAEGDRQ